MNEWFIIRVIVAGQEMYELRKWSEGQQHVICGGLFATSADAKRTCDILNSRKLEALKEGETA